MQRWREKDHDVERDGQKEEEEEIKVGLGQMSES
jgi:hypothetical protein